MKWQYKVVKHSVTGVFKPDVNPETIQKFMNGLGDAGWELVSASSVATGNGATIELVLILKRPADEAGESSVGPPPLPQPGE